MIVDIYQKALESNCANLKSFNILNEGTLSRPRVVYELRITFEDIMNHFGVDDIYDLPENIKEAMMKAQHYEVIIKVREDSKPLIA